MRTSGESHEGWMSLIPLSVLLFVVMVEVGGPEPFANLFMSIANDAVTFAANWLRHL
jgi:p-aminobenzoyl-glutamate transporter AbgT